MTGKKTYKWRGREFPAPPIQFDEVNHIYRDERGILPGVTSILNTEPVFYAPGPAAEWGKAAHDHLYHFVNGSLDIEKVSPRMMPTIEGFRRALVKIGLENDPDCLSEFIVYSRAWRYAGRLDFLFAGEKYDCLVDFKSGALGTYATKMTGLQLGGYSVALCEMSISDLSRLKAFEVNVQIDGKEEIAPFDTRDIHRTFLAHLTVQKYWQKL